MANFTNADVMALRQKTGVGMMDCKKALVETNGNIDEAIKYLREKGMATASKKADMDSYEDFDYEITNDTLEKLKEDVYKIYQEETK